MAELAERLGLDLTDALARDVEAPADLFEGVLALLADAEAETQDLLLLGREHREGPLHLIREVLVQERLIGRACRLVLEEVAELGILPDRRLQRQGPAGRLENQAH